MCDSDHIVTAVRPSKKVPGRYSVYVDGKFAATLAAEELVEFGFRTGVGLSSSEFALISDRLASRRLRETAFRLLSCRSRSEKELSARLAAKGFAQSGIEDLVSEFREKGLLSDRRFAEDWVDGRMRCRPRGSRLLVLELLAKGVPEDLARRVVGDKFLGVDETDLAYKPLRAFGGRFLRENSVDRKRKMYNFLQYRGFCAGDILRAVDRFLGELDDETGHQGT